MNFFLQKKKIARASCASLFAFQPCSQTCTLIAFRGAGPKKSPTTASSHGKPLVSQLSRNWRLFCLQLTCFQGLHVRRFVVSDQRRARPQESRNRHDFKQRLRARSDPRTVLVLCRWRSSSLQTQHAHHRETTFSPVSCPVACSRGSGQFSQIVFNQLDGCAHQQKKPSLKLANKPLSIGGSLLRNCAGNHPATAVPKRVLELTSFNFCFAHTVGANEVNGTTREGHLVGRL